MGNYRHFILVVAFAANGKSIADVRDLNTALVNVVMSPAYWQAVVGRS